MMPVVFKLLTRGVVLRSAVSFRAFKLPVDPKSQAL